MGKQIYILNNLSGSAGVAKIVSSSNRSVLLINLEKNFPGRKLCRIVCGEDILDIGSFYKKKTEFEIPSHLTVDNILIEENGNPIAWSGIIPNDGKTVEDEEESPEVSSFDTFFGGGFEWHRIRGNFIMFDYSIIHHILSLPAVYRAINRAGYYCAGIKKTDDITLIALAVPLTRDAENPFSAISADKYKIYSGKHIFETVCVGIDKSGEFFISN